MADAALSGGTPQPGRLICLRLPARDAQGLDTLVPGLSQLGICRQMPASWSGEQQLWLRLGPDEWWCWWAHGRPAQADGLMQALAQALDGLHHACVDLSDGQQGLLTAAPAGPLLSAGCDLDFERLPQDLATRSRLASFSVVLAAQGQAMLIWVEASLGLSLQQWLERAARQLGR